ncbi:MAG TPA: penicillin-binding protein 2 [Actinomycetota bacterium]
MDKSASRLKLLALLVALMFAGLSARLWYLQVLASEKYVEAQNNNLVKIVRTEAPRGRILDAKGHVIVGNRASTEVLVEQQKLGDDPEAVLYRLSQLLHVPVRSIVDALGNKQYYEYEPIPVAVDVPQDYIAYIAEHRDDFPGVSWTDASVRTYPYGSLAAHILGSLGRLTPEQTDDPHYKDYSPSDLIGQSGLESEYERFLRGQKGYRKLLLNAAGELIRTLGEQEARPGLDIRLYLNTHLQGLVETQLREGILKARSVSEQNTGLLKATSGAVVVLDPHTFGVEAIASYPTFDPKWFVGGITEQRLADLKRPTAHAPLFSRATQAEIPPGSTFKPFIALSAIKRGIATLGGYYPCPPEFIYGTDTLHPFHNWSSSNLGSLTLHTALQRSCDTVFYKFGADFYDKYFADNSLGKAREPLQEDLTRLFGFGRDTGIDLPSEQPGLVPTAAWKAEYAKANPQLFNPDQRTWLPADDILMSIGQGFVTVTPLQLASAYAAIANDGKLCAPRLAAAVQDANGDDVRAIKGGPCRKLPFTHEQLSYIRGSLESVLHSPGTAAGAFAGFPFSQVAVSGKTGTAQREPFQDTSWFVAMVGGTIDDPDHIIVVMVEEGGHGSTTAAPIARSIIEQMYGLESGAQVIGGETTD